MDSDYLNICQVSLRKNIPIITQNYFNFLKFYKKIKIYIICPANELEEFSNKLNFKEFTIINEDSLISLNEFKKIFYSESSELTYKKNFIKRINWYYQQILKISFTLKFIENYKNKMVIWDADTILLKKIDFFKNNLSVKYGNFNEFHKEYFLTNDKILGFQPKYFISFLNQFVALSFEEFFFFKSHIFANNEIILDDIPTILSRKILKSIFLEHKIYNGSMFSEYELIGQSNYKFSTVKQIPLLSLRFGLDGILTNMQISFIKSLNFIHITYEHSHPNEISKNLLHRNQNWLSLLRLIFKNIFKFYLRLLRHNYRYYMNK